MYFRVTDKSRKDGYVDYVKAPRGSQIMFDVIDKIVGMKLHPDLEIPYAIEVDGWADDCAYPDCAPYETDDFIVECISDEEFFENQNSKL